VGTALNHSYHPLVSGVLAQLVAAVLISSQDGRVGILRWDHDFYERICRSMLGHVTACCPSTEQPVLNLVKRLLGKPAE
jgi:hypothetical protein